ncbi:MAG: hypothetical protein CL489_08310 [Acidobacteria bacterium]|nr:hypothetical protein [Acidobacteriota bacterium]|tara:strand:+ start:22005 stop:22580 length:576 start_codon:yes stop_codon:yes gene_type:complete
MTEQEVIDFAEERIEYWFDRFGINRKPYKICVGDTNIARGRFKSNGYAYGICDDNIGLIVIDYRHVETGTEEMIKDTVLHEIAHAIDKQYNGYSSGHGRNWKRIACIVGATPKAKSKDTKEGLLKRISNAKYAIIDKRNPTKPISYCQRRLKNLHNRYYPNDPSGKGNLYLVESGYFMTGDVDVILKKMFR